MAKKATGKAKGERRSGDRRKGDRRSGGWMSVETGGDDPLDPFGLEVDVVRDVGRARLTFLRRP